METTVQIPRGPSIYMGWHPRPTSGPLRHLVHVLVIALASTLAACGAEEPATTDSSARFVVETGEEFAIVLESNLTTGYAWALAVDLPTDVVTLVSDEYFPPDTDLVGAPGHQELTFRAVGDGSTFIRLWYIRSFDDPPQPAEREQFEVVAGTGTP